MFEQLDSIDWSTLTHAYGEAVDTPGHIRALLSSSETEFEDALYQLWASICHQGSVYPASSIAVPFLIEILEYIDESRKPSILSLLAGLAGWHRYAHRFDTGLSERDYDDQAPGYRRWTYQQFLDEGNIFHHPLWMKESHDRVGDGSSTLVRFWPTSSSASRIAIVYVLAAFQEQSATLIPPLQSWLKSTQDIRERAAILLCLGSLVQRESAQMQTFLQSTGEENHHIERLAAALALTYCHYQPLPPNAIHTLITTMVAPVDFDAWLIDFPWFETRLSSIHVPSCYALAQCGDVGGLTQALANGSLHWRIADTVRVAEALLDVAFYGQVVTDRSWRICSIHESNFSPLPKELDSPTIDKVIAQMMQDRIQSSYYSFGFSYLTRSGIYVSLPKQQRELYSDHYDWSRLPLTATQRVAIQAAIDCEPLWQVPTNLFDLYTLPSSRQELIMLLNDSQQKKEGNEA